MINMYNVFKDANEAFNYFYDYINRHGHNHRDTKRVVNVSMQILNPTQNIITNNSRQWKKEYAEAEWQWYLSGDRNISKLGDIYGKVPIIWQKMADANGNVNSNYGYQWNRNNQLQNVIELLRKDPTTRQAVISIYDGKEASKYEFDTPCTLGITFDIHEGKLNMTVIMRSNDLWYGFCNDQYCFSELQKLIARELAIQPGWYYHFANNLHLYNNKLNF